MNLSYVSYSQEECDPRIENIIPQDNYCIDQVFAEVCLWLKGVLRYTWLNQVGLLVSVVE